MQFSDPVRQLIADRTAELGISHAELSRAIGRGASYINQYLRRGSPVALDDRERQMAADALGLDEAALTPGTISANAAPIVARHQILARSNKHIPVFTEGREIDFDRVTEWTDRPDFVALSEQSFALWVHAPHGRIVAGDLAYVTGGRPTRPGDMALALTMDQHSIVAIGEITEQDADRFLMHLGAGKVAGFNRRSHVLLKIAAVRYA